MRYNKTHMNQSSTFFIVLGVIGVSALLLFGIIFLQGRTPASATPAPITTEDHIRGATSTPVTLIEYMDFECAACAAYFPILSNLEKEFDGRVTFVVRYFPLSQHMNGMPAALAAEAAGQQGKYWQMHDMLFSRQKEWGEKQAMTPEVFERYASELGLNMDQYRTDVASQSVKDRIARDVNEGRAIGINSTPTFFLNGTKLQNPQSEEAFRAALQAAVTK